MADKLVYPSSMPFDEVKIIDNSIYSDNAGSTVPGVPTGPIAFMPFISPRGYGEDNTLVYMDGARLSRYGTPNLKKYGLSLYLANRFIDGGGTVLGMRVVPSYTAEANNVAAHGKSYANACVYAVVDTTAHTINYGVTNMVASANTVLADFISATAQTLCATVAEGATLYKLFVIRAKSAGDFANGFYFSLANDPTMNTLAYESNWAAHFYRFSDSDSGSTLDANMVFTFADGFLYENESMDPEEVFDNYSENVVFEKVTGATGLDAFMTAIGADGSTDFMFPTPVGEANPVFVNNATPSVSYTITNTAINAAIHLAGGLPLWVGEFAWDNDIFADDLTMAYGNKGSAPVGADDRFTDLIYDQVRYPFQYIFAPTYDEDVVKSIHELVSDRYITHAFYIIPFRSTYSAQITAYNATTDLKAANDFREHLYSEWAFVRDPYIGKKTRMPSVYMNAYEFPKHWNDLKGKPYAGADNFAWTDYIVGTVQPQSAAAAQYITNHNSRFNTMIEDGYGNAVPYEQITAQTAISALSECNNSFVLTDMIRIALALAQAKRWTDLSDDAISTYKDDIYSAIDAELGSCYDYVDILTSRESVNGAGRNRIKCSITVKFKDILKGVSYTFYISAT